DVRLDEPFDLRAKGAERFIAFKTDRTFKLTLNESALLWGAPAMNGSVLYALADKSPDDGVFLRVPGGADRLIERDEVIDLTAPGVERFVTAPLRYEIIVNARPHVVVGRRVTFEQVVELAFPGSQSEPNTSFSMTYRRSASTPHAGELAAGGSVHVQNGTIFNVTKTVQS
ncbi:MAG: multiubiquitin domain-containing protein, partial [Terricaulis sp.]